MDAPAKLTRDILRVVLAAALVTAPVFLIAEGVSWEHAWRVAASNGVCIVLCAGLLALVRSGRAHLAAQILVYGLLALVAALASTNGEPVHVNVVNIVLVSVLSSALLPRTHLIPVGWIGATVLVGIALHQAHERGGEGLLEESFEPIVQFLPTYLVILTVLWLRSSEA